MMKDNTNKTHKMTAVPDTEYVTLTEKGFFIGGQSTKEYRGLKIQFPSKRDIHFVFTEVLYSQGIKEIHCLTSETCGVEGMRGIPTGIHGVNIWCCIKMIDNAIGDWVLIRTTHSPDEAAFFCMKMCFDAVWGGDDFIKALAPKGTKIIEQEIGDATLYKLRPLNQLIK